MEKRCVRVVSPSCAVESSNASRHTARLCRALALVALSAQLMIAPSSAFAQGLQFLGVTPPSQQQAGPFSGEAGRVLQSPSGGGRQPHEVLPTPPEGKVTLGVYAAYGADRKPISRGLVWRVFSAQPDPATGAFPLVAEKEDEAMPVLFLTPGKYIIHVSYGLASLAKEVTLGQVSQREAFELPAGGLRLQGDVEKVAINSDKLKFDIFEGSFLQGRTSSQPYYKGATAGEVLLLPEGIYHVVSSYGDANAVVRADVNVSPGKLTDATMHHRAAEVTLKLVKTRGGEMVPDTQWTIITPGGDTIQESIGAQPTVVLSEGSYTAIGRNNGVNYSLEFKVEPGQNQQLEVLMNRAG